MQSSNFDLEGTEIEKPGTRALVQPMVQPARIAQNRGLVLDGIHIEGVLRDFAPRGSYEGEAIYTLADHKYGVSQSLHKHFF